MLFSDQPILSRFPTSLTGSNSRSNIQIYSQLQIPSTSNFGSMKKKKKNKEEDPSTKDTAALDQNLSSYLADDPVDNDTSYVPDYISIKKKPVKV